MHGLMNDNFKRRLFVTRVESVLLYGFEAWALTVKDEKALDGVYTCMLRAALNVSWKNHMRNTHCHRDDPHATFIAGVH